MSGFIRIPSNPIPDGAEAVEIAGADGAPLRAAFFPASDARATVIAMTGWSEFIEKYFETVRDLQARAFNVAMMDWRGQGLSDRASPKTSQWDGYFDLLQADLRNFADNHVKPRFGGPTILMTHSMGGVPGLKLLASGYEGFVRAVLCAPMTRLFKPSVLPFYRLASEAACLFGAAARDTPRGEDPSEAFEGNIFTSDPARHERFRVLKEAHPRATNTGPTFGWLRAALKADREIHAPGFFDKLKTPTRIISAGNERQVHGADHEAIAAASDLIDYVTIPGALHEIMMERNEIRALYWKAFDGFVAPVFGAA